MTDTRLSHCVPVFACHDIGNVLAFCAEHLGFDLEWVWGEPPTDGCVKRDDVRLMFMRDSELCVRAKGTEVIVFVADVDALYADHQARTAPIVATLSDKPWNVREYTVELPPGYLLRFAESLERTKERRGS